MLPSRIRSNRISIPLLAAAILASSFPLAWGDEAERTVRVAETYNQKPFDYKVKLLKKEAGYRIFQLTYPSPVKSPVEQNNTIHAKFYWPDNPKSDVARRPAVIALTGLDGKQDFPLYECKTFAERGMAAVTFSLPCYNERVSTADAAKKFTSPLEMFGVFAQAIEDVRRTVDLLASHPKIDPECINLTGMSFGAIISATAAGKEPRVNRTCLFLGGGDLIKILRHAAYTRDLSKTFDAMSSEQKKVLQTMLQGVEPLAAAPGLKERAKNGQVLMINATKDEIIPRDATFALARALGIPTKEVVMMKGQHCTVDMPQAVGKIATFFAKDLPANKGQSAIAD